MQLAKRDTRLFWGGQTRNVFFGVLLFWLEKWRLWLMWPLFVWNFCVSFTQWCAMVGLWIQGHTARTESHDSTMQHMIRVQAFILKRSKKRSKKQFGGPKSWGLEPGTSLKCSNLLRIHTWGVENIFQHPWLVDAKASPGEPGWNQSDLLGSTFSNARIKFCASVLGGVWASPPKKVKSPFWMAWWLGGLEGRSGVGSMGSMGMGYQAVSGDVWVQS